MRVEGKGLIDRDRPLSFQFDGHSYRGFEGDTLASALLANDRRLVARSFKYHRPRGILTAGSEEPNALVTIGSGANQDPNVRATVQEIYEGLEAHSQNAWPSLSWDILSVNDLAAPFLSAGFYYKTFMWPRAFWEKLYEPFIRRAAGLGALSGQANPARYEKAFAFCDLLVIGAGPTGLMAALTAAKAGADVILADEDAVLGGQLNSDLREIGGKPAQIWAAETAAELARMNNVRLMPRTTITGVYDDGVYGGLERVSHHLTNPSNALPKETFWRIASRQAILASGALERPIAFRNNDRPGIMTAGAIRTYLNRFGVSPGKSVTLFANNDEAHLTAVDLIAAGVHVAAVVDVRPSAEALGAYRLIPNAQIVDTSGRSGLEAITIRTASGEQRIFTDCLGMSGGWNPTLHLTCHMNGRPVWNDEVVAFLPSDGAVPGLHPGGACAGVFSTAACLKHGVEVAGSALDALDLTAKDTVSPQAEDDPYRIMSYWAVPGKGRAWLDFQNDVTVKDIRQAAAENFRSVEHMKRYTTQGMATDQGKSSNVAALALLADATGRAIPDTGTTTFRPPFNPVALAALGAGAEDKGFAPERKTTSHAASLSKGAPMIEAGLWYRPSYFPASGETNWRQSCDREVGLVRKTVGICDVSTLGKIDIQGPDAARLLDLVYANTFSSLKPGKVRYGLMLREDGHVMDDGTTARLGAEHFVMTTTTAAAGQVMRHLEFVSQAIHPEWDVRIMSVTEQWAQFAVAGPKSPELLNGLVDNPINNETWPFMCCGPVMVHGVSGRLFRISFSGEHAYELAVPARFGDSLFRVLVARAEALGGGAYGMEALNVLRIEKGFITHSEIDGRVTAFDVGMDRMISDRKDCIGKRMAAREGLKDPDRPRLVGLKPVGIVKQLTAGAHIFCAGKEATRENSEGYITSVCFSPSLGHFIGLGFVKRGPERLGEQMQMVDHVRSIRAEVELCDPVFLDPEGGRARG